MAGCGCNISNLGYSSCGEVFGLTKKIIFVRTFDDDGNRNKISRTDFVGGELPEAFIDAKLNETTDKRWYPLGDFNQVTEVKADDTLFTDDFGASYLITKGAISYEGFIESAPNSLESKVNTFNCGEYSAFFVDTSFNLTGIETEDDCLLPVPIAQGTLRADWIKISIPNGNVNRLRVNFTMDSSVTFGSMNAIEQTCNGYDLSGIIGLFDATSSLTVNSDTELKVDVDTDGGTYCTPQKLEGLVLADFAITNDTLATTVTPSSVVEAPAGCYTITIPAQVAGELGTLTITKAGFEIPTSAITFA